MNKLEQLYKQVKQLEEHYQTCADKAWDKNNALASTIHSAEAGAYARVRWMIEDLMEEGGGQG